MKKVALLGCFALFAGCMGATDEGADPTDDQQGAVTDTVEGGEGNEISPDSEEGGESLGTGEESPVEEEEAGGEEGGVEEAEAILNKRFVQRTDLNMGANTYAFVDAGDGALFVCGENQISRVTEAEGAEPYLDAKCDVITVMGDRLYYNSRTSGQLYHLLLAGNSAEGEPVGDPEASPVRSMSIANQGEGSVLYMAQGESGVTQYDPATNEVVTVSPEPMTALHVSSIPGTDAVLVGTSTGIRVLGSGSETEILSGATDIGWVEEDGEGNWRFATVNPLGISVFSLDGSLSSAPVLESTLSPGAHPFVLRKGFASLWSEIVALEWEETAENQVGLKITGRFAQTYTAPGRTVHRHFVDVLSQEDGTVIALHDQGLSWFNMEEQGPEPDIHAKNLVLKMSPPEPGGPASVLALIQNRGEAPLVVSDISIDTELFEWSADLGPGEESEEDVIMVVAPGDSGFFEVSYGGGGDEVVGRISVTTNDPDEPEYQITARVNVPNIDVGHGFVSTLVPDASGKLKSLADWSGKVVYAKFFNGL